MKSFFVTLKRKLKLGRNRRKKKRSGRLSLLSMYRKPLRRGARGSKLSSGFLGILILGILISFVVWISVCIYKLINLDLQDSTSQGEEDMKEKAWKGEGRINVLLVGMDKREGEFGYVDSLIVLMVDPIDKKGGIFVINVDSNVNLGLGKDYKLRSIYNRGVLDNESDPKELLIKGVEALLSIKIGHYILVDEDGLVELSNSLGGIYVNNSAEFEDEDISKDGATFKLNKGAFRLGGEDFLNYLRADDDGQEGKSVRQIDGAEGFLKRAVSYNAFIRLPTFIDAIDENVETNLSKSELVRLSYEVMRLQEINSGFMGNSALQEEKIGDEIVYYPILDILDQDIQSVFGDSRISKEQARVEIFNSTNIQGLAAFRARWLKNISVDVIRTGDTSRPYEKTTIFAQERGKYVNTINAIKKSFDEEIELVEGMPDFICTGDVIVVLGQNVSE